MSMSSRGVRSPMTLPSDSYPDLEGCYYEEQYNARNYSFDKFYHNMCNECNQQFDCNENVRLHFESIHPDKVFIPMTICLVGKKLH